MRAPPKVTLTNFDRLSWSSSPSSSAIFENFPFSLYICNTVPSKSNTADQVIVLVDLKNTMSAGAKSTTTTWVGYLDDSYLNYVWEIGFNFLWNLQYLMLWFDEATGPYKAQSKICTFPCGNIDLEKIFGGGINIWDYSDLETVAKQSGNYL